VATRVQAGTDDVNAVRLRGRVSTLPERRVLPSGDEVVVLRLVVRRAEGDAVDALDVSVGPGPAAGGRRAAGHVGRRVLAAAERLAVDDRVEVVGQLRRRWWDAGGTRRSRLEVRVTAVAEVVPEVAPRDDAQAVGP
jgi:single-strand DNA-binding protein